MAKKTISKKRKKERSSLGKNILLTLTLVPIVLGILLIGAWALDIEILENQSEVQVGIFFLLLGFALSNALQKRFGLAAGWGSLAVADFIILTWWNFWAQTISAVAGLIGAIFLGVEFYKQYQQNKVKKAK